MLADVPCNHANAQALAVAIGKANGGGYVQVSCDRVGWWEARLPNGKSVMLRLRYDPKAWNPKLYEDATGVFMLRGKKVWVTHRG